MANDRIFLRCKHCHGELCFYKYYPSGGYVKFDSEYLTKFIEKHLLCSPFVNSGDLGGDTVFELCTEDGYLWRDQDGKPRTDIKQTGGEPG